MTGRIGDVTRRVLADGGDADAEAGSDDVSDSATAPDSGADPTGGPSRELLSHVLVPLAHPDDAAATAAALAPYAPARVTAVHVVEKGGGVPDKTPVEQSEQLAAEAFEIFHERFPDAATRLDYGEDVVERIIAAAQAVDAAAIAFRARPGGRLSRLLTGDLATRLITEADRPVIALPDPDAIDPDAGATASETDGDAAADTDTETDTNTNGDANESAEATDERQRGRGTR